MADTKISALTALVFSAVADGDELPIVDVSAGSAGSKFITVEQLKALFGDSLRNVSTADQSPAAATLTLITGSTLAVPVDKLRIGTVFRWQFAITKTAAGVAARSFFIKLGTLGTTGDATIITFAMPVPTAVIDSGLVTIIATVRGPLSASCIMQAHLNMVHNLQNTGLALIPSVDLDITSGVFNATNAALIASVAVTTGAAEVLTFKQVIAEALNI